jgi:hypothetical protein
VSGLRSRVRRKKGKIGVHQRHPHRLDGLGAAPDRVLFESSLGFEARRKVADERDDPLGGVLHGPVGTCFGRLPKSRHGEDHAGRWTRPPASQRWNFRLRHQRGDRQRRGRPAGANHRDLIIDDQFLGESLGDIRHGCIIFDDDLDLPAGNYVAARFLSNNGTSCTRTRHAGIGRISGADEEFRCVVAQRPPHFSGRGVGQGVDLFDTCCRGHRTRSYPSQQRATIKRRLDAPRGIDSLSWCPETLSFARDSSHPARITTIDAPRWRRSTFSAAAAMRSGLPGAVDCCPSIRVRNWASTLAHRHAAADGSPNQGSNLVQSRSAIVLVMVAARQRYGGSKVGRSRARNWIQGARGIIQIVLCAGYFDIRFGGGAILPVGRYRRPWRREGAGIFHGKQHFKRIRIEQVIALDHMDFVGVRRTGAVHPAVSPKAGVLAAPR